MNPQNNIHVLSRAVILDEGHLLLCETLHLPHNFYFLPGGHVQPGESIENSLRRELLEETGAECKIERLLGCLEYSFNPTHSNICHTHEYNFVFEATSDSLKKEIKIPPCEAHIKLTWMPLEELSNIDFRAKPLLDLIPVWLKTTGLSCFKSVMEGSPST